MSFVNILHLPQIKIHNANALSSPFTVGFPAMTAWLGFTHALQRKLQQKGFESIELASVAVVNHQFDLQTYKGPGDFVSSIIGTGNPLDKTGERSAFIEEARCHLTVSLIIEFFDLDVKDQDECIQQLQQLLPAMKIAGGDIMSFGTPEILKIDEDSDTERRSLLRKLMPGYVLIERRDLMLEAQQQGEDALDAMLGYLTVNHHSEQLDDDSVVWHSSRKTSGWIVPIATGFQAVSEPGPAINQRDTDTPHRFAESIVTLGEFVMPFRIQSLDDMLWSYHTDLDNNLYLCQQNNQLDDE